MEQGLEKGKLDSAIIMIRDFGIDLEIVSNKLNVKKEEILKKINN